MIKLLKVCCVCIHIMGLGGPNIIFSFGSFFNVCATLLRIDCYFLTSSKFATFILSIVFAISTPGSSI